MTEIRNFAWFVRHSWAYMKGQRLHAALRFWSAWRLFQAACASDRAAGA